MRNKIQIDTLQDAKEFSDIASTISSKIIITDAKREFVVNAKSLLGVIYSLEFDDLYVESDIDIYMKIKKYVVD